MRMSWRAWRRQRRRATPPPWQTLATRVSAVGILRAQFCACSCHGTPVHMSGPDDMPLGSIAACRVWRAGASTCCRCISELSFACPLLLPPTSRSRPTHAPTTLLTCFFFAADGVTYVTPTSFDDALRAAGAACALVDAVVAASRRAEASGTSTSGGAGAGAADGAGGKTAGQGSPTTVLGGLSSAAAAEQQAAGQWAGRGQGQGAAGGSTAAFSLCRPPGHHATADTPLGYCLFNNVALAARHAQRVHGLAKVGGGGMLA